MRGVESPGGLAGMVAQNAFRMPTGIDEANWEVGCAPKCPQGGCRGGTHPSAWRALHGGWGLVARKSRWGTGPRTLTLA
jgi:hypothetical protein